MKINYTITSHSIIEMSGQRIFDTNSHQHWEVEELDSNKEGSNVLITVSQSPQTQTSEVQASFRLMELMNQPFSRLHLLFNKDGEISKVVNKEEIKEKWEQIRKQLPDLLGDEEVIRNLVAKTNESIRFLEGELRNSIFHFMLFFPFRTESSPSFIIPSVLNQGDLIKIGFQSLKKENEFYRLEGEGELFNRSKLKKQYRKEIQPYTGADFNYQSSFRMNYQLNEADRRVQQATTDITEQASEGYIYQNHIEISRINEVG